MISTTTLTRWLFRLASYSPPVYTAAPFLRDRHLTHRERLLYAELEAAHTLALPRSDRHWQVLAHLAQHRPIYDDTPVATPPQKIKTFRLTKSLPLK